MPAPRPPCCIRPLTRARTSTSQGDGERVRTDYSVAHRERRGDLVGEAAHGGEDAVLGEAAEVEAEGQAVEAQLGLQVGDVLAAHCRVAEDAAARGGADVVGQ